MGCVCGFMLTLTSAQRFTLLLHRNSMLLMNLRRGQMSIFQPKAGLETQREHDESVLVSSLSPRIDGSCAVRSDTDCNRAPPRACLTDSPTMHWGRRLTSCLDLRSATHSNPHKPIKTRSRRLSDRTSFIIAADSTRVNAELSDAVISSTQKSD